MLAVIGCGLEHPSVSPTYFNRLHHEKVQSDNLVQWTQFGPGNMGWSDFIEYHPTDPHCIITSPNMHNTYGSWDNGTWWQTTNDCDGTSLGIREMRSITFSRQDPDVGLVVDERGWLWRTEDRGRSWTRDEGFPARGLCSYITFDPSDDRTVYVGGGNFWNLMWNKRTMANPRREIPTPDANPYDNYKLICDFDYPLHDLYQTIYKPEKPCAYDPDQYARTNYNMASRTEFGKVWRSMDGGKSWELVNSGLPQDLEVGKILIHPENQEVLYMATTYGLYKSANRGDTWTNIGNGLPHNILRDLAMYWDENAQGVVLVAVDQVFWNDDGAGSITSTGGVYKSTNEGATWTSLNNNLFLDLTKMSAFVADSWYRALAGWMGAPQGQIRQVFPRLPQKALQNFNRILIDPTNPQRMYLGHCARHDYSFYAGDLWKTEDGGKSWIVCNRVGPHWRGADRDFWEERGNPTDTNMQFGHLHRQVMELPYGGFLGTRWLTMSPEGDLVAIMEQQTLQSTDQANSWQQIDAIETAPGSGMWVGTGASNVTRPRIHMDERLPGQHFIYCGEHGMFQIDNEGNTVNPEVPAVRQVVGQTRETRGPESLSTFAIHPHNPDIWYMQLYHMGYTGHVMKTIDAGKSWESISQPIKFNKAIPVDRVETNSLLIDQDEPDFMYFCTPSYVRIIRFKAAYNFDEFGVYRSVDAGVSWSRVNSGLPAEANVWHLCFDPENNKTLYAAVMKSVDLETKGGLYRSENRGESWDALPIPPEIEAVNYVVIHEQTKDIYIACGFAEGTIKGGGVWKSADNGTTWQKIFHMPVVYQVDVSPLNPNMIAVSVGEGDAINYLNPGAYLSFDGGNTWHKSNRGIGQPYWIQEIKFDIEDPDVIWCGLGGSGWYRGVIDQ